MACRIRGDQSETGEAAGDNRQPQPSKASSSDDDDRTTCPIQGRGAGRETVRVTKAAAEPASHRDAALPSLELLLYLSVLAFLLVYVPWYTHQLSQAWRLTLPSLKTGWSVFGHRKKDTSSYPWTTFVSVMTSPAVILSYTAYIVLGQLVILVAPEFRKGFMLGYTLLWIYLGLGRHVLTVLLLHTVIAYLVSLTRRPLLLWIFGLAVIATIYVKPIAKLQEDFLGDTFSGSVCINVSVLRLLCFGLDFCRSTKPQTPAIKGYGLFDLLLFNFYLPVFPYGPFIDYDTFANQVNSKATLLTWTELRHILKELVRCLFWAAFAEGCLHYLYFGAMAKHTNALQSLSPKDLSMVALLHLFFFQASTLVFYSLSRTIALFDRIQAPRPPICILSIHFFRDMWRYFDRGLNAFLTRYIYIPLGGSRRGALRQSLAALACFLFAAWWHGGTRTDLAWALLNWLGVQLEAAVLALGARSLLLRRVQDRLSPPMLRRFYVFCAVPNYLFLASSNLVFVIGPSKTVFFARRMFLDGWPWNGLCICAAFYCCMQVVNELERRVGRQKLLSKNYI